MIPSGLKQEDGREVGGLLQLMPFFLEGYKQLGCWSTPSVRPTDLAV